jgi:short subunit dehydrogenase-like uncharacterized protein
MKISESNDNAIFDIIIYGASSFTGKLVLEYFFMKYSNNPQLKWGIAGRNHKKLMQVLTDIREANPTQKNTDISIVIADCQDPASLNELTKQTKVILTTVGPYAKYGSLLVASCVENGTDYCDLAGETQWIRKMIDTHQTKAEETGARIIHACGFDSIPSDMGVFYMQEEARKKYQKPLKKIQLFVKAMKGGASGGTIASILNVIAEGRADRDIARTVSHPYGLNPNDKKTGPDKRDQASIIYNYELDCWTAPFFMASINTRIVRRSNALMNFNYGEDFSYTESTICGKKASGWIKAIFLTLTLGLFLLGSANRITRKYFIEKLLPKPGQGPNKEQRNNGFFKLIMLGRTKDGERLSIEVTGDRDPGYGSTSKILSETAVCLASDKIDRKGGIWTPASALGGKLLSRLQTNAGMTFKIL